MRLSDESVKRVIDAIGYTFDGQGPASITLSSPGTDEPMAVVFVIPAPVGVLVDTFLNDLYTMLGWHTEQYGPREAN